MKKVVSINLANYGSTGKIMRGISKVASERGYKTFQAYPGNRSNSPKGENDIVLCTRLEKNINQRLAYITGLNGCFAIFSTIR